MPTGRRRILGCSRGTHSGSGGWRRRNGRSPYNVRLICSMLAIIHELHISLVVNDPTKKLASSGCALPIYFAPGVIRIRIANEFKVCILKIPNA
jgi:hypothetical protein